MNSKATSLPIGIALSEIRALSRRVVPRWLRPQLYGQVVRASCFRVHRPSALLPTPTQDRGLLLTPDQVAAVIGGVSRRWVLRHVRPRVKLGQRTVRFYAADVEAWVAERRGLKPEF